VEALSAKLANERIYPIRWEKKRRKKRVSTFEAEQHPENLVRKRGRIAGKKQGF